MRPRSNLRRGLVVTAVMVAGSAVVVTIAGASGVFNPPPPPPPQEMMRSEAPALPTLTAEQRTQAEGILRNDPQFQKLFGKAGIGVVVGDWLDADTITLRGATITIMLSNPVSHFDAMLPTSATLPPMGGTSKAAVGQSRFVVNGLGRMSALVDITRAQILNIQPDPGQDIVPLRPKDQPSNDQS